jgi:cell wall-associated NlpC family hydrolase
MCEIKATGWPPSDHYGEAVVVKYQTHSDQEKLLYTSAAKSTVKQQDMMLWPLSALPLSSREALTSRPAEAKKAEAAKKPDAKKEAAKKAEAAKKPDAKKEAAKKSQNFRTKETDTLQLNVSFWEKKMGTNWEK